MLGREFVAFRIKTGEMSILGAFFPHFGAHLGHGGTKNREGKCTNTIAFKYLITTKNEIIMPWIQ